MTLKQLALTGVCDFECWHCHIEEPCKEHNSKDNDHIEIDQTELRKQWANEQLEPMPFEEWVET